MFARSLATYVQREGKSKFLSLARFIPMSDFYALPASGARGTDGLGEPNSRVFAYVRVG